MAQIKISALTTGTPKGTDLTPATDTTDTTQAASGTTKKYIRSDELNFYLEAQGLTAYSAVLVATTVALTVTYANGAAGVGATLTNAGAQAALTIDGVLQVVGNRVLVKNQAAPAQNGIYTVTTVGTASTNWVMTRATDFDQAADVIQYAVVLVNQGTVNAGLLYQETGAGPFTMGTTDITFAAYTTQSLTLPVSLAQGGTSASLTANNGGIFYSTATAGAILAGTATAGKMLQSGATAAPAWSTPTYPSASGSAGLILRSDGTNNVYSTSTFADTYAVSTLLYASSSNAVAGLATVNRAALSTNATGVPTWLALTDGQIVIGSTAGAPAAATLTPGTGISIAGGSNSITISATGGGFAVATVSGTSQNAAVNTMYILLNAAQTTVTFPGTCSVGDTIIIVGSTANVAGWIADAPAGDTLLYNGSVTSAGGTITSAALAGQTAEFVCDVADTSWVIVDSVNTTLTTA